MTNPERREFRSWVVNLTAKTSTPWCVHLAADPSAPIEVRLDPIVNYPRADLVLSIPPTAMLADAKIIVIDALSASFRPS